MSISRRKLLTLAGGAAGAAAIGAAGWSSRVHETTQEASSATSSTTSTTVAGTAGRTLVVVQLNGGNDALNTLVPASGSYYDARPAVSVAEGEALALADVSTYGLHPSLEPLLGQWDSESLAIVAGVGIDGQTRSHFSAGDTWASAEPGAAPTTGWLGRWLDATGDASNPLRGISLGDGATALRGETVQATAVGDPATFALLSADAADAEQLAEAFLATSAPVSSDEPLSAAQMAVPSALEAVELLDTASASGSAGEVPLDAPAQTVSSLLATAAGLIDLDVGTQVIVVGVGGFDTHSGQSDVHAGLLGDVADGIDSFLGDIDRHGRSDDVVLMTTSEFGRRVKENASGGTDHGSAGVQFLAGSAVAGGLVGGYDLADLDDGDLRIGLDTRSMYAAALDWLGGTPDEALTNDVLAGTYDRLGLIA